MAKNSSTDYADSLTSAPVSTSTMASHRHYLSESDPLTRGLDNVRDQHSEKFSAEELAVLAMARRILDSKRVDCCLIEVKADDAPIFF